MSFEDFPSGRTVYGERNVVLTGDQTVKIEQGYAAKWYGTLLLNDLPIATEGVDPQLGLAQFDSEAAEVVARLDQMEASMDAIVAMTNASINSAPAPVIKDVAREVRALARRLRHAYLGDA